MARMDDTRNKMLFDILREDCSWREERRLVPDRCSACRLICAYHNCEPLRFAIFFNRPEVKHG